MVHHGPNNKDTKMNSFRSSKFFAVSFPQGIRIVDEQIVQKPLIRKRLYTSFVEKCTYKQKNT